MTKMKLELSDLMVKNIEKIRALFPNCITETMDEHSKLKKPLILTSCDRCLLLM